MTGHRQEIAIVPVGRTAVRSTLFNQGMGIAAEPTAASADQAQQVEQLCGVAAGLLP